MNIALTMRLYWRIIAVNLSKHFQNIVKIDIKRLSKCYFDIDQTRYYPKQKLEIIFRFGDIVFV